MKAVLLNSGGIDSRVVAARLVKDGWQLHSLFIDWNPLVPAGEAAQATADLYCKSHHVHPFGDDWRIELPALHTKAIPYTAVASHTLGAMYASTLDVRYVMSGVRAEVATSCEWLVTLRRLFAFNRVTSPPIFSAPLYDCSNEQVNEYASRLNVDLSSTLSCMISYPECGTCNSCKRREAL